MSSLAKKLKCGDAGFSLIELLVVVAILSATTALVFSSLQTSRRPKSPDALARDAGHLAQFVRLDAINSHRPRSLVVDVTARTVSNERGDRSLIVPVGVTLEIITGRELIRSTDRGMILFFPDGSSSGGELSFSNGNSEAVLRIPWLTGIPSLQRKADSRG